MLDTIGAKEHNHYIEQRNRKNEMKTANEATADLIKESLSDKELWRLGESDEYADYIMQHGDRLICNGDMLLAAMEDGYMFDEFLIKRFV